MSRQIGPRGPRDDTGSKNQVIECVEMLKKYLDKRGIEVGEGKPIAMMFAVDGVMALVVHEDKILAIDVMEVEGEWKICGEPHWVSDVLGL